jgi:hypothetical protein
MCRYYIQFDAIDLFGKEQLEPFKIKEIIKVHKFNEKGFTMSLKALNKIVHQLIEDFQRYRMGKITFRKTVTVGGVNQ